MNADLQSPATCRLLHLAARYPQRVGHVLASHDPAAVCLDSETIAAFAGLVSGRTAAQVATASRCEEIRRRVPWMASLPACGIHPRRDETGAWEPCGDGCGPDAAAIESLIVECESWRRQAVRPTLRLVPRG